MPAISRVPNVKLATVYVWGTKVLWVLALLAWVQMQRQHRELVPASSFDEMWTYQRVRHGAQRPEV